MNTLIGFTAEQETEKNGEVLQTLLLLGRKFLGQAETGIQHRHARNSEEFMQHVPPRVWRRHSALLSLLIKQTATGARVNEAE